MRSSAAVGTHHGCAGRASSFSPCHRSCPPGLSRPSVASVFVFLIRKRVVVDKIGFIVHPILVLIIDKLFLFLILVEFRVRCKVIS
jgi:hypothetical protein